MDNKGKGCLCAFFEYHTMKVCWGSEV